MKIDTVVAIAITPLWLVCAVGWTMFAVPLVVIQAVVDKANPV